MFLIGCCSVLGYVAFFVTICYHTIYAVPWIFPPLAFYGFDMLLRLFRYRIKDATLVPVDNQMTLVSTLHGEYTIRYSPFSVDPCSRL